MRAPRVVEASVRYRSVVLTALSQGGWQPELEQSALRAVRRLNSARRTSLRPDVPRAARATVRTLLFVCVPLWIADRSWTAGRWWVVLPFLLLAGMGLYGLIAILHDLVHGSFLPSKRANLLFGRLLGPLLLLDFEGLRRSHLGHHEHSQSESDPKRFGVQPDLTKDRGRRTVDYTPWVLRGVLQLGASVIRLPLRVRHFLYLFVSPLFLGPAVLFFGGEFSVVRREWRRPASWLAAFGSAVWLLAWWAWSPTLLVLFLLALTIGFSFTFHVFATHLTPNQVYWQSARRAVLADALNVSDVQSGALLRWLGHGLSNYHSTHHLAPALPCYHLPAAHAMVAADLEPLRAPAIDLLDAESCALLFDALFRSIVSTKAEAWDYAGGGRMRRPAEAE
jgi:omega-6 fatty acid desaturase (delta-12 desaturase)